MANLTKALHMPNGQEYEFVGKHWFGYCTTSAGTQTKTVTISGFNSSDLVDGTQVTIRFLYGQTFNGAVLLRINTGTAYAIAKNSGNIERYEWAAGETITFVYYSSAWYIINSGHATTTYWGKTKLSSTIANNDTVALTPKAVYNAGYITLADLPIWDGSVTP